jgi:hypothetical protein
MPGLFSALFSSSSKPKVFVSYSHQNAAHYRNLLKAWNENSRFDFDIEIKSPLVAINSSNASRVKAALTQRIQAADIMLILICDQANQSEWMNWEIEKGRELGLKFVAVKIHASYHYPNALYNAGAIMATSFSLEAITGALEKV